MCILENLYDMRTIEEEVKIAIDAEENKRTGSLVLKEYEATSKKFSDLIRKGVTDYRGYNLETIEDVYKTIVSFNAP